MAFTGLAWLNSLFPFIVAMYILKQAPNFIFCPNAIDMNNACECDLMSGGFEIYNEICTVIDTNNNTGGVGADAGVGNNSGLSPTVNTSAIAIQTAKKMKIAKTEFSGISDAVTGDVFIAFMVSIITIVLVFVIFSLARTLLAYSRERDAAAIARKRVSELEESNIKLQKQRESFQSNK